MISLVDTLNDNELEYLINQEDYTLWLEPFKHSNMPYSQYRSRLGTMKKNSPLVKAYLPGIVIKLFRKNDPLFLKLMEQVADKQEQSLLGCIEQVIGESVSRSDIEKYDDERIAEILIRFEKEDNDDNNLDFELLWIQLKLLGIELDDKRKKTILSLCANDIEMARQILESDSNHDINDDEEIDDLIDEGNDKTADQETKPKKVKNKKLTAQEKAEKNKRALEKKKKEEQPQAPEDDNQIDKLVPEEEESDADIITEDSKNDKDNSDLNVDISIDTKGEDAMVYIGIINIIGSFYNFTPIGSLEGYNYSSFTEQELDTLLPKSTKNNINFYYNVYDSNVTDFMDQRFKDGELAVLNCEIDELDENRSSDGQLNQTGYKLSAVEGCNNGKIQYLTDVGLHKLIHKDELADDIATKRMIRLKGESYIVGETVLISIGDGLYAGPYRIKYQSLNDFYYIVTQENNWTGYIVVYNSSDCQRITIDTYLGGWNSDFSENYYYVKSNARSSYKDLVSDEDLLKDFSEIIKGKSITEIDGSNIKDYIDKQNMSLITGKSIPAEIKEQRLKKLKNYIENSQQMEDVISGSYDVICDLILKNKDSKKTEELLSSIIENRPDFFEKIQGIRIVKSKIESAKMELAEVEQQKSDIISQSSAKEVAELNEEIEDKKSEITRLEERIKELESYEKLNNRVESLKNEEMYLEEHKRRLIDDTSTLEQSFVGLIKGYSDKMADITFDGFISNKMLQSAAEWERKEEKNSLESIVRRFEDIKTDEMEREELIKYLVDTIKIARPDYDKNTILNIIVCSMQGFLTVFSGIPGCGKTSICNIVARVLGLTDYSAADENLSGITRYVPVSVERGWTSKRDFVGYFNPLTKSFEENNRDVYKGLKLLNEEYLEKSESFPFYILLDEANLSPMEYYWADFMNVCDDRSNNNSVNLGNDNVFYLPDTLHFFATINNDHTTETLSPRLIDRAWVITLPRNNTFTRGKEIPFDNLKHISWRDLRKTFISSSIKSEFNREISNIFEGLKEILAKQSIYLSPRVNMAIFDYWKVASEIMEADEYSNQPDIIALDFAVAQKILPKISGNGEEIESWLIELKEYCNSKSLIYSSTLLEEMIDKGNRRMKYYEFFN